MNDNISTVYDSYWIVLFFSSQRWLLFSRVSIRSRNNSYTRSRPFGRRSRNNFHKNNTRGLAAPAESAQRGVPTYDRAGNYSNWNESLTGGKSNRRNWFQKSRRRSSVTIETRHRYTRVVFVVNFSRVFLHRYVFSTLKSNHIVHNIETNETTVF